MSFEKLNVVADTGLLSNKNVTELAGKGHDFILGTRIMNENESVKKDRPSQICWRLVSKMLPATRLGLRDSDIAHLGIQDLIEKLRKWGPNYKTVSLPPKPAVSKPVKVILR